MTHVPERRRVADLIDEDRTFGIFGIGGHGRELHWLAIQCGIPFARMKFIADPVFQTQGTVNGTDVVDIETFSRQFPGAPVFVGIGDPTARHRIVAKLTSHGHRFPPLISPHALLSPTTRCHDGVVVFHRSVISVNVDIGAHAHVNVGCSISHDVTVGAFSSLSPGVNVCGGVKIGADVFVGANACVIHSVPERELRIGDGAYIAAGACVTHSVDIGTRVAGVPARPMK